MPLRGSKFTRRRSNRIAGRMGDMERLLRKQALRKRRERKQAKDKP